MANDFPAVQGGGSLILAYQVRDKNVLVVGGGEVSVATMDIFQCFSNICRSPQAES